MRVLEAKAIISATGHGFEAVTAKLNRLSAAAGAANKQSGAIGRATAALDKGSAAIAAATTRILAPVAAGYAAGRAVRRYAETDMAITRIGITADATDDEIAKLHKRLRDLAYESGKPFDEVAEGLNQLVAGGLDLPQALPAMPAIARTAQASGAEVRDIANSSLALSQSLGISAARMQDAFDIMVAAAKAGKVELKDMARHLPSIAPAAAALGMKGEEGLKRIVALLQVVRNGTGTVEEAASSVSNIFAKMESEETAKRFKKFGVDLRKEMATARAEGKDLLQVFTELTQRALKGDLSKIPQLFQDMELSRGMRALLTFRDLMGDVLKRLEDAKGSVDRDFDRVSKRAAVSVQRLAESWDRATEAFGRLADRLGGSTVLNKLAQGIEYLTRDPENPPRTVDELRARMREGKQREQITALDQQIKVAERDVAAADATAKLRPGLGRDPGQARAKLERLLAERETLQRQLAPAPAAGTGRPPAAPFDWARDYLGYAAPPTPTGQGPRLPAHIVDRDMSGYFGRPETARKPAAEIAAAMRGEAGRPIEANLKGAADVKVTVQVEPSPDFLSRVRSFVSSVVGNLRINGTAPAGSTGSSGVSMPEAGPHP